MEKRHKTDYPALTDAPTQKHLYSIALFLAIFTVVYNFVEGIIATFFGYQDESVTLFGFGIDSFIELISGLGIAHMIMRIRFNPSANRDAFERTALKITGFAFYGLMAGLLVTGMYNIWIRHKPIATFWGIIIASISIMVMLVLIYWKTRVGRQLHSEAILADAQCTKVCIYMSVILLLSSGVYALTDFAYMDSLGAMGLAYFSFKEGRECFEKANSEAYCSCEHD